MAALLSLAIKVQSYFFPSVSSGHRFVLSLCVVIIASAPNRFANSLERSFAPPICPDKTGITYLPVLSIQTTAGSVCLSSAKGAILRTQIPIAPINTKLLDS